jgi:hypothetical protein
MAQYGIIVTEKVERDEGPLHWLKRGTVVEILEDGEVICVAPSYGVDIAMFSKRKHRQFINQDDFIEIDSEQLEALRAIAN